MPAIRSASEIASKWAEVTPARRADYEKGVSAPLRDYKTNALAAAASYEAGITGAIADKRWNKGVERAGTEKWSRKAREVGTTRWGPGVAAAKSDYEKGFAPYRDIIEKTVLPPRFSKGDDRNWERSKVLGKALFAARTKK
jgi:hypothetical protein